MKNNKINKIVYSADNPITILQYLNKVTDSYNLLTDFINNNIENFNMPLDIQTSSNLGLNVTLLNTSYDEITNEKYCIFSLSGKINFQNFILNGDYFELKINLSSDLVDLSNITFDNFVTIYGYLYSDNMHFNKDIIIEIRGYEGYMNALLIRINASDYQYRDVVLNDTIYTKY